MFDLKVIHAVLDQLQEERGIPKEKVIEAIELALATAYKKEYGKRGQIVRSVFNTTTGDVNFEQVKLVVDETTVKMVEGEMDDETNEEQGELLPLYNEEQHILLKNARLIRRDAELGDELVFPLAKKEDFGRISAQTAKQVIIQKIREAERVSVFAEFEDKQGDIISGTVQRVERGNVFIDLGRATGIMPRDEQIPSERYRQGERIRAYLFNVEDGQRGIYLRLSRSHPEFLHKLFTAEAPEIATGVVEIRGIAREAGSRSKIAVYANDPYIDPVGACVGQRGVRVQTVTSELGGEKIDVIEWSENPKELIEAALSPARILSVEIDNERKVAYVVVSPDQQSLAIGRGGQNARLAAKLTGWKIDISSTEAMEKPSQGETQSENLTLNESESLDFADSLGDDENQFSENDQEITNENPELSEENVTEFETGDETQDERVARQALEDTTIDEEGLENTYSSLPDDEQLDSQKM
jgi:N utilization substance protein A